MMTSSVSSFWNRLRAEQLSEDRNVAEPWHLRDVLLEGVLQQAARAQSSRRCPNSTVVSARRTVRAGIVTVLFAVIGTETAPVLVSSLTSGRTRRLTCCASMIVGVKSSLMPNSLNATVIVAMPLAADPATGTGNSPPARKLAGCPLVAVRLGSARIVISPSCARASTVSVDASGSRDPNAKLIVFWTRDLAAGRPGCSSRMCVSPLSFRPIDAEGLQHGATRPRRS